MRTAHVALALAALGCGSTPAPVDAPARITGITIDGTPMVAFPYNAALMSTVHVDDGSSLDVTTETSWTSDTPAVATITAGTGLITSLSGGTTVIHATYETYEAMVTFTVTMPTLVAANLTASSITFYAADATGAATPLRTIAGATTTLAAPHGIAIAGTELFVSDETAKAIDVFAIDASGDVAPVRRIVGAATTLGTPSGIAVANNEIFVTDQTAAVKVFAATESGNVAPIRTITGASTNLSSTFGIALSATEQYVVNAAGNSVAVFPLSATGNVAPTRLLVGAATGIATPHGAMLVPNTAPPELHVSNAGNNSVAVFAADATGNTAPLRTLVGVATTLATPDGLASLGSSDYIANQATNTILVFATTSGNGAPKASITGLGGAREIAIY